MLFVAKSAALGHFGASWVARRAGTSIAQRKTLQLLLSRLHLLTPPMNDGPRVASYKERPNRNPGPNPTPGPIPSLSPSPNPNPTVTGTGTVTLNLTVAVTVAQP